MLKGKFFLILFSIICFHGYSERQKGDSLRMAYQNAKHDTTRCDILVAIGELIYEDNLDSALLVWTMGLNLAEKNLKDYTPKQPLHKVYLSKIGIVLNDLAAVHIQRGNLPLAIDVTNKSLKISKELGDKEATASCLNNLGMFYAKQGDLAKASEYYFECLKISEELKDKRAIGYCYMNIGALFLRQGEKEEALNYYLKCLKIREEQNDKLGTASILANLGNLYERKKDIETALNYFNRALKLYEEANRIKDLADTYNSLANLYSSQKKYELAMQYYSKAHEIRVRIGDKPGIAMVSNAISKTNLEQGKLKEAREYALKALKLSQEIGYVEDIMLSAHYLRNVYARTGDYKNEFEMYKLYIQSRDSVNNAKVKKASLRAQIQYEYDKKEAVLNEQQEKERLLAEEKSRQQKIIIWSVIGGLVLVMLFSVVILNRLRVTRRQKELIESQKKEVEKQKEIIEQKNTENELLLGEIHHRVKNNLQVISSLLSLQERSMESDDAKSAILEGKERVKSMELVHKMLYQENSFSGIEMCDYVNKLSLGLIDSFGINPMTIKLDVNFEPITLDVDTAIPIGLILNELIVNSLKHAKRSTEQLSLKIAIHEDAAKQLHINIADNGEGKITEIENSNSFGLKIIRALIRQLNGVMNIEENEGLSYSMTLKNYKLIR